jgi:DNA-directed RNA polymerase alpha subunit
VNRPYLIWSDYHGAWFRPAAAGYTVCISEAGVFTDRKVEPTRERKVYRDEAYPEILKRRAMLIRELALLTSIEEALYGGTEAIRLTAVRGRRVDALELSVRASNCLRAAGIHTIGDLTSTTRTQLLNLKHFGRRSLNEVLGVLDDLGLKLRKEE